MTDFVAVKKLIPHVPSLVVNRILRNSKPLENAVCLPVSGSFLYVVLDMVQPLTFERFSTLYESLLSIIVNDFGGDVSHMTTDGMLVFFDREKTSESTLTLMVRAIRLACVLRDRTAATSDELCVRFGVARGDASALFVGGVNALWHVLLAGTPLASAYVCAYACAEHGSIVLDEDDWMQIRHHAPSVSARPVVGHAAHLCALRGEFNALSSKPIKIRDKTGELDARLQRRLDIMHDIRLALHCYVFPVVARHLRSAESAWLSDVRTVCVVTLRFTGLRYDAAHVAELHNTISMVQTLANHYGGTLVGVWQESTDTVARVVFGLPPVFIEVLPPHALDMALQVLRALHRGAAYVDARVGVSTGRLTSGIVSCTTRKTYFMHGIVWQRSDALSRAAEMHSVLACEATMHNLEGFTATAVPPIPLHIDDTDVARQLNNNDNKTNVPNTRSTSTTTTTTTSSTNNNNNKNAMVVPASPHFHHNSHADDGALHVATKYGASNDAEQHVTAFRVTRHRTITFNSGRGIGEPSKIDEIVADVHAPVLDLLLAETSLFVASGESRLVVVEAAVGLGKMRVKRLLVNALCAAPYQRLLVLESNAEPAEQRTPFYVWRAIFAQLVAYTVAPHGGSPSSFQDVATACPVLYEIHAHESTVVIDIINSVMPFNFPLPRHAARTRPDDSALLDASRVLACLLSDLLDGVAKCVVLGSGTCIDSLSWRLIDELRLNSPPVLMILFTRPPEPIETEAARLHRIITEHEATFMLRLAPWRRKNIARLACAIAGADAIADVVADFITYRAQGNPLFATEITRALLETHRVTLIERPGPPPEAGSITSTSKRSAAGSGSASSVESDSSPRGTKRTTHLRIVATADDALQLAADEVTQSTIHGVIQKRIDLLSPAQQLVLRVATVIGRVFDVQLLIDIMPLKHGVDAGRQLAELCELGYFERATPNDTTLWLHRAACRQHMVTLNDGSLVDVAGDKIVPDKATRRRQRQQMRRAKRERATKKQQHQRAKQSTCDETSSQQQQQSLSGRIAAEQLELAQAAEAEVNAVLAAAATNQQQSKVATTAVAVDDGSGGSAARDDGDDDAAAAAAAAGGNASPDVRASPARATSKSGKSIAKSGKSRKKKAKQKSQTATADGRTTNDNTKGGKNVKDERAVRSSNRRPPSLASSSSRSSASASSSPRLTSRDVSPRRKSDDAVVRKLSVADAASSRTDDALTAKAKSKNALASSSARRRERRRITSPSSHALLNPPSIRSDSDSREKSPNESSKSRRSRKGSKKRKKVRKKGRPNGSHSTTSQTKSSQSLAARSVVDSDRGGASSGSDDEGVNAANALKNTSSRLWRGRNHTDPPPSPAVATHADLLQAKQTRRRGSTDPSPALERRAITHSHTPDTVANEHVPAIVVNRGRSPAVDDDDYAEDEELLKRKSSAGHQQAVGGSSVMHAAASSVSTAASAPLVDAVTPPKHTDADTMPAGATTVAPTAAELRSRQRAQHAEQQQHASTSSNSSYMSWRHQSFASATDDQPGTANNHNNNSSVAGGTGSGTRIWTPNSPHSQSSVSSKINSYGDIASSLRGHSFQQQMQPRGRLPQQQQQQQQQQHQQQHQLGTGSSLLRASSDRTLGNSGSRNVHGSSHATSSVSSRGSATASIHSLIEAAVQNRKRSSQGFRRVSVDSASSFKLPSTLENNFNHHNNNTNNNNNIINNNNNNHERKHDVNNNSHHNRDDLSANSIDRDNHDDANDDDVADGDDNDDDQLTDDYDDDEYDDDYDDEFGEHRAFAMRNDDGEWSGARPRRHESLLGALVTSRDGGASSSQREEQEHLAAVAARLRTQQRHVGSLDASAFREHHASIGRSGSSGNDDTTSSEYSSQRTAATGFSGGTNTTSSTGVPDSSNGGGGGGGGGSGDGRIDSGLLLQFSELVVEQVVYEMILPSQRQQLHISAAEWYERTYAGALEPHYALLAHHWSMAERCASVPGGQLVSKAVYYLERAAEHAERHMLFEQSAQFLNELLQIAAAHRDPQHIDVYNEPSIDSAKAARWALQLGQIQMHLSQQREAVEPLLQALLLAGFPAPSAGSWTKLYRRFVPPRLHTAGGELDADRIETAVLAYQLLCYRYTVDHNLELFIDAAWRAFSLAERLGDPMKLSRAASVFAYSRALSGDTSGMLSAREKALTALSQLDATAPVDSGIGAHHYEEHVATTLLSTAAALIARSFICAGMRELDTLLSLPNYFNTGIGMMVYAVALTLHGRLADAVVYIERAAVNSAQNWLVRRAGYLRCTLLVVLGQSKAAQEVLSGDATLDPGLTDFEDVVQLVKEGGIPPTPDKSVGDGWVLYASHAAVLALTVGDFDRAAALLIIVDACQMTSAVSLFMTLALRHATCAAVHLAVMLKDSPETASCTVLNSNTARALAENMVRTLRTSCWTGYLYMRGWILYVEGHMARLSGRQSLAIRRWTESIALAKKKPPSVSQFATHHSSRVSRSSASRSSRSSLSSDDFASASMLSRVPSLSGDDSTSSLNLRSPPRGVGMKSPSSARRDARHHRESSRASTSQTPPQSPGAARLARNVSGELSHDSFSVELLRTQSLRRASDSLEGRYDAASASSSSVPAAQLLLLGNVYVAIGSYLSTTKPRHYAAVRLKRIQYLTAALKLFHKVGAVMLAEQVEYLLLKLSNQQQRSVEMQAEVRAKSRSPTSVRRRTAMSRTNSNPQRSGRLLSSIDTASNGANVAANGGNNNNTLGDEQEEVLSPVASPSSDHGGTTESNMTAAIAAAMNHSSTTAARRNESTSDSDTGSQKQLPLRNAFAAN